MARLAAFFMILDGWKRFFAAFASGALASLALPPLGAWPVLFVAFPALVWLMDGAAGPLLGRRGRARAGFFLLHAFALGWFGLSLWWIGEAFLVDAAQYAWLMPFALVAMPAGLALFWGLAGAVAAILWPPGPSRVVLLATTLGLAEVLREHLFGGFPWNVPAHASVSLSPLMQMASLVGIQGLSFLVILWAAAPALLADDLARRENRRMRGLALVIIAMTALAAAGFGIWRQNAAGKVANRGILVRLVQPAIPQKEKWKPQNRDRIFRLLLALSAGKVKGGKPPRIIIWPESAVPFLLDESPTALQAIARILKPGQILVTGALRRAASSGPNARQLYNSILAVNDEGRVIAVYDKRKLVPFGEYLPLAGILEPLGVRRLVNLPGGFLTGKGDGLLRLPGLPPAEGLICYEAIFPALASRKGGARWLVNVTNDGWFGRSFGPWQHLAAARFRAIEQGLPMARVANTGISALVGPLGRLQGALGLFQRGVLDVLLPPALTPPPHARWGAWPVVTGLILLLLFFTIYAAREENTGEKS